MGFIIIYITHPDMKTAKKIAAHLLAQRLIACANFFPIKSSYWWQGKIENAKEVVTLVKTSKKNWNKVKSEVKKIHPYDTPCIIRMEATANADYEKWIKDVISEK
ncbi:divalent-cation tolerance protein CutA [Candidatus Falkowbacteria bacterium]|nr:divalent-cation tolerance protein CutA [Candidatus Falkowbacteria bacterium]